MYSPSAMLLMTLPAAGMMALGNGFDAVAIDKDGEIKRALQELHRRATQDPAAVTTTAST